MELIFWAVGTNGEGSSKVVVNLIKALIRSSKKNNFKIFISSKSTLHQELISNNLLKNCNVYKLPKICRLYPIQFLIKFFLPVNIICKGLITLDDYPFRNATNQILYFHQPNIIFSENFIWKIKRFVFNILLTNKIKIFVQTKHINKMFLRKFPKIKSMNIITALHFDK